MTARQSKLLQGTLDLLILKTLALGPMHGLGVSRRLEQISGGVFQVNAGSLFPALHRLEHEGWVEGEWGRSEAGRRAKYYKLTRAGRRQLGLERRDWLRMVGAIERVLSCEASP